MSSADRRTGVRLPVALPVKARFGRVLRNMTTLDVSRNGVFVVSDRPPTRGQLVHVSVILPGGGTKVPLRGMVLHVVTGEDARKRQVPAGMGIQFYGLGRGARERWDAFFDTAYNDYVAAGGVAHPPTPAAGRRSTPGARPVPEPVPAPDGESTGAWRSDLSVEDIEAGLGASSDDEAPTVRRPSTSSSDSLRLFAGEGGLLAPTGAVDSPVSWEAPAHFRLCPPDVPAMLGFRDDALESGGVVLVGAGSRTPGWPAVVSVVHPATGAEFHVPGEIAEGGEDRGAVVVRFLGVTEHTKAEFVRFAQAGRTPALASAAAAAEPEMTIYWSPEEASWDLVTDPEGTVLVERALPLEAAVNPFYRPR